MSKRYYLLVCHNCNTKNNVQDGNISPICNKCNNIIAYSKQCKSCDRKYWGKQDSIICNKCYVNEGRSVYMSEIDNVKEVGFYFDQELDLDEIARVFEESVSCEKSILDTINK
uniref:Uncharacterized protein n=1 Tax=Pithovirus LCPAC102 TaxID=2506587 RepID=A0A481Z2W3_9VIRU|nr:MAG: hypothetical protein LCPAC102_00570 [Pithovirus LCPAC102]